MVAQAKTVTERLALGTAQLGMSYGIANRTGQPDLEAATQIVVTARSAGIRYFDTAQAYGDSETVLGSVFQRIGTGDVAVVTKLPPQVDTSDADAIVGKIRESLRRLGMPSVWGILLHREDQLDFWDGAVGAAFARAKSEGLVSHAGVSVYSTQRALEALKIDSLDALQVPASIFDRRMSRAGVFAAAARRGVSVFVRSIFLQGLALLPSDRAPVGKEAVMEYERFCREHNLDRRAFALQYALSFAPDPVLVIGAETPEQVAANCAPTTPLADGLREEWDRRWSDDVESLVNPSLWKS